MTLVQVANSAGRTGLVLVVALGTHAAVLCFYGSVVNARRDVDLRRNQGVVKMGFNFPGRNTNFT